MTIGTSFAIERLKEFKIYCISPPRVNVSGMINLMCFDKTGTITEENLSLLGILKTNITKIKEKKKGIIKYNNQIINSNDIKNLNFSENRIIIYSLVSCNSLTKLEDGNIIGDPLEIKIFESTNWLFKEDFYKNNTIYQTMLNQKNQEEKKINLLDYKEFELLEKENEKKCIQVFKNKENSISILKRFDFNSGLQRMSVIVEDLRFNEKFIFIKGLYIYFIIIKNF
jgi:cation-transporting P-type ATPase 13A2